MGRAGELPRTTVRQFANASHCRENKRLLQVGLQSDLRLQNCALLDHSIAKHLTGELHST